MHTIWPAFELTAPLPAALLEYFNRLDRHHFFSRVVCLTQGVKQRRKVECRSIGMKGQILNITFQLKAKMFKACYGFDITITRRKGWKSLGNK